MQPASPGIGIRIRVNTAHEREVFSPPSKQEKEKEMMKKKRTHADLGPFYSVR